MKRIAVFASGNGTNFENIAERVNEGKLAVQIALCVSDQPQAYVLERAKRLRIPTLVLSPKAFSSKQAYEQAIVKQLREACVDYVILAGYMRIVGDELLQTYAGRILNIHPSLLPAFKGSTHAIQDAFQAKAKETGVTVHVVTADIDGGPVVLQQTVPVDTRDTLETLEAKVHAVEYELYPRAIQLLIGVSS